MSNPYETLPQTAFWRTAIAARQPLEIGELWRPKFRLAPADRIATFGSCFAQHFGRALKARGYAWLDAEPAPDIFSPAVAAKFNYGVFSARTGNVYTVAALRQWVSWAAGLAKPPDEIWQLSTGRYVDPCRPSIEPDGFASVEELRASRAAAINAVRRSLLDADWFVFTLGLTEGWVNAEDGHAYAMCPGTIAGEFDVSRHIFKNYGFAEISADVDWVLETIRAFNGGIRFILTVSPVPLTATASGQHVLTATTFSKSVLRAVAGTIAGAQETVDYFPSYEIINSPPFQGMFYRPNKRSISEDGVSFVMDSFFACLGRHAETPAGAAAVRSADPEIHSAFDDDAVCEEQMLAAFAPGGPRRARR